MGEIGSLFKDVGNEFLRYAGVTNVFPEIEELIRLESNLKLVNVQVSGAIASTNKFKKDGTEAFRDLSVSSQKYSQNMKTVHANTVNLSNAIYAQSMMLGTSIDTMYEMVKASSDYGRILGGDTVGALALFQEATDFSTYVMSEHTAKMIASRKIEERETKKYLTGILAVREQYGLASEDLYELFNITEKYANTLNIAGNELISHSENMAIVVSSLKKAGLEASFSSDLIDRLIDPSKIEDNIILLNKLGISMSDISFGAPIENAESVLKGLKDMAEGVLSHSGRITQAKMAEFYGFSLDQITKIANIETETSELNREKSLIDYRREMMSTAKMFENAMTKVFGTISLGINKAMGALANLTTPFLMPIFAILTSLIIGGIRKIPEVIRERRASLVSVIEEGTALGISQGIAKGLVASEGRVEEHFKTASGLTPSERVKSPAQQLEEKQREIYGGATLSGSFKAGYTTSLNKKLDKRGKRLYEENEAKLEVKRLYEEKMSSVLGKEAQKKELEEIASRDSTGIVRGEYNKMIDLLNSQIDKEKETLGEIYKDNSLREEILGQVSTITQGMLGTTENIRNIEAELKEADAKIEASKKEGSEISYQELEAVERLKANKLNQLNKANAELAAQEAQLKILGESNLFNIKDLGMEVLKNTGYKYGGTGISFDNKIIGGNGKINSDAIREIFGSKSVDTLSSKAVLNNLAYQNKTSTKFFKFFEGEVFKKSINGIGRGLDRILGTVLPGIGGGIGKLVGGLGPQQAIFSAALGGLTFFSTRVVKQLRENKKQSDTMERLAKSSSFFLEKIDKGASVVADFIDRKFLTKTADILDKFSGRTTTNLEDATLVYIRASLNEEKSLRDSIDNLTKTTKNIAEDTGNINANSLASGLANIKGYD